MNDCDVLVIDDEPVVREGVRRVLESNGLRVATAPDGASGLAHPAIATCRLVLCDLMLPDASGIDVVREITRRRPGLPTIVITGYATADHASRSEAAGAVGFLAKPFEASELMDSVRLALVPRRAG
jgi:DNA-binding NtrC family response regulator